MSSTTGSQITDIDRLVSEIAALADRGGMAAVAIAGPPGSGKSTIAANLRVRIGARCCVVPMDGFHLDNDTLAARGLLSVKGAPDTFDLAGFTRLVDDLKSGVVRHFPTFDRDADSVVERGGVVPDGASMLLFEGNYLLFDEDGWADLAGRWDASLWLEVPEDVLEDRLTRRWIDQGMSKQDALARAQMNDLANARRVIQKALPATWVVAN
jgi:pantothenate kinase